MRTQPRPATAPTANGNSASASASSRYAAQTRRRSCRHFCQCPPTDVMKLAFVEKRAAARARACRAALRAACYLWVADPRQVTLIFARPKKSHLKKGRPGWRNPTLRSSGFGARADLTRRSCRPWRSSSALGTPRPRHPWRGARRRGHTLSVSANTPPRPFGALSQSPAVLGFAPYGDPKKTIHLRSVLPLPLVFGEPLGCDSS